VRGADYRFLDEIRAFLRPPTSRAIKGRYTAGYEGVGGIERRGTVVQSSAWPKLADPKREKGRKKKMYNEYAVQ
jgi:hypothetical protein